MKKTILAVCLGFGMLAGGANATPTNFSFTGSFPTNNTVQTFNFAVAADSTVTMRTWSWAGGTNAQGQVIAAGGFDPILALFNSTGVKVGENDDGGCTLVASNDGVCWDTYLDVFLTAGTYTVSIAQYDNFAGANLSDGFPGTFQTNFGGRTNQWAFDLLNVEQAIVVDPAAVPEPASIALLGLGLAAIAATRKRKNAA